MKLRAFSRHGFAHNRYTDQRSVMTVDRSVRGKYNLEYYEDVRETAKNKPIAHKLIHRDGHGLAAVVKAQIARNCAAMELKFAVRSRGLLSG